MSNTLYWVSTLMECLVSNQNAWFSFFVFNEYMHFVKGLPTHLLKATVVWKSKQEFQPTNRPRHPSGPFSVMANRLELTPGILVCHRLPIASIWYSRSHIEIIKSRQLALPPIRFLWVNANCVHEEAFMTYVFLSLLQWNKLNLTVQHLANSSDALPFLLNTYSAPLHSWFAFVGQF